MSGCGCDPEINDQEQGRVLKALLAINAVMFFIEIAVGTLSESTALIADSLDMLADAAVYGIGLYATGKPALAKVKAAHLSGLFQILLGVVVVGDVIRRFVIGSEPDSLLMVAVGSVAALANITCLKLISKYRAGEVHMRASWVFSRNDVIANLGVIVAGCLVYLLSSRVPDLVIGLAIAMVVVQGGIHIVIDATRERRLQ